MAVFGDTSDGAIGDDVGFCCTAAASALLLVAQLVIFVSVSVSTKLAFGSMLLMLAAFMLGVAVFTATQSDEGTCEKCASLAG